MKILIVAQKIDRDDENLGFFHRWIEEFAKYYDRVVVIAGFVGKCALPENVAVYSLGKEKGAGRLKRLWRYWRFFGAHHRSSDAVFFHMIPEFVIASSPFLLRRRGISALWYVHKSVTRRLCIAERAVDYIFTASELSFRLPSKKAVITGHAIDTDLFCPAARGAQKTTRGIFRIVSVGRISPVKDIETMILACAVLQNTWDRPWTFSIIGGPLVPGDEDYLIRLKDLVREKRLSRRVHFLGPRAYVHVPAVYRDHDMFISLSRTGSVDKSVLEAMSAGISVISSNEAFRAILPAENFLENRDPEALARRIIARADSPPATHDDLRDIAVKNHGLSKTIKAIVGVLTPRP